MTPTVCARYRVYVCGEGVCVSERGGICEKEEGGISVFEKEGVYNYVCVRGMCLRKRGMFEKEGYV